MRPPRAAALTQSAMPAGSPEASTRNLRAVALGQCARHVDQVGWLDDVRRARLLGRRASSRQRLRHDDARAAHLPRGDHRQQSDGAGARDDEQLVGAVAALDQRVARDSERLRERGQPQVRAIGQHDGAALRHRHVFGIRAGHGVAHAAAAGVSAEVLAAGSAVATGAAAGAGVADGKLADVHARHSIADGDDASAELVAHHRLHEAERARRVLGLVLVHVGAADAAERYTQLHMAGRGRVVGQVDDLDRAGALEGGSFHVYLQS